MSVEDDDYGFTYEDDDHVPLEDINTHTHNNNVPLDANERRVSQTLAVDAFFGFVKFVVYKARLIKEEQEAVERVRMYEQQELQLRTFNRRFLSDLEAINPEELQAYCKRWDTPWDASSAVHARDRRIELQRIQKSRKWCTLDSPLDDVDNLHPYVNIYKSVTGKDFEVAHPFPSIFCSQMLIAHVHLYSMQRAVGDFFPELACFAYQEFFSPDQPNMRREATEFLRALALITKKFNVVLSTNNELTGLILRQLLHCTPVTTMDIGFQLREAYLTTYISLKH